MSNQNVGYEIEYWEKSRQEDSLERYSLASKIFDLQNRIRPTDSVIDLGCGPHGGIFNVVKCSLMVGIDPLWEEYGAMGKFLPKDIVTVIGDSNNFNYDGKVDCVFSMNALDHSGDLSNSISEIIKHIKIGGIFMMHVHMRTKKQLNSGHKMLITEEQIDLLLAGLDQVHKQIVQTCPFDNKPYASYLGIWRLR